MLPSWFVPGALLALALTGGVAWWLLHRHRATARPLVTCYLRENGPIAFELPLFRDARGAVEAMLASELSWFWQAGAEPSGNGPTRDWTQLSRWSLAALLADATDGPPTPPGRTILLIGITGDHAHDDVHDRAVRGWLTRFTRLEDSPVLVAIHRANLVEHVFVQQQAPDSVNTLLQAWGIDKQAAERRAYARLGPASLEAVFATLTADR